jgi:ketosteroid isomerase-like protein
MPTINNAPETVEEVETAFYEAIGRADVDVLMSLWADDEGIVCIHPGAPRLVGHASIRSSWESIFERGGVRIRPVQMFASQNTMTAVHNIIEEVQRSGSAQHDIHILATNVYMKTEGGWRIVTHHASVVPGEAPADVSVSALLH